jgi:hypothetical protein
MGKQVFWQIENRQTDPVNVWKTGSYELIYSRSKAIPVDGQFSDQTNPWQSFLTANFEL